MRLGHVVPAVAALALLGPTVLAPTVHADLGVCHREPVTTPSQPGPGDWVTHGLRVTGLTACNVPALIHPVFRRNHHVGPLVSMSRREQANTVLEYTLENAPTRRRVHVGGSDWTMGTWTVTRWLHAAPDYLVTVTHGRETVEFEAWTPAP